MTTFIKSLRDQTNIDKYRVGANIREYHIISKISSEESPVMIIRQIFHEIMYKCQTQHVSNGGIDYLVTIIELLQFLYST